MSTTLIDEDTLARKRTIFEAFVLENHSLQARVGPLLQDAAQWRLLASHLLRRPLTGLEKIGLQRVLIRLSYHAAAIGCEIVTHNVRGRPEAVLTGSGFPETDSLGIGLLVP